MSNLTLYQNSEVVIKNDIVVGKLPKVTQNDIILYNKKQTEKRIEEYKNSDKTALSEIDKIIAHWGYGLGITVDAHDILMLNDFIRENFGQLNIFDLRACVKLIHTESDLLKHDAEHYGKLTMNYVSKVLKSYITYRNSSIFKVREEIENLKMLNAPKITDSERLSNFKKLLYQAKEESKIGASEMYADLGDSLYNFIKHNKLMPIVKPNIDQVLIMEAMDYGKKSYERKKNSKAMQAIIKGASFSRVKKEDLIKKEARIYVVNKMLMKTEIH